MFSYKLTILVVNDMHNTHKYVFIHFIWKCNDVSRVVYCAHFFDKGRQIIKDHNAVTHICDKVRKSRIWHGFTKCSSRALISEHTAPQLNEYKINCIQSTDRLLPFGSLWRWITCIPPSSAFESHALQLGNSSPHGNSFRLD